MGIFARENTNKIFQVAHKQISEDFFNYTKLPRNCNPAIHTDNNFSLTPEITNGQKRW